MRSSGRLWRMRNKTNTVGLSSGIVGTLIALLLVRMNVEKANRQLKELAQV